MPLGTEVGPGPGYIVLDGQTAGRIKTPLGTEVGLGLRDIVLDVKAATPRKKGTATSPNFLPMSIVAKLLDG